MGWQQLYEVARRQHHGAFAVRDAPSVGLTARIVEARALRESWERPQSGVVLLPGYPVDHRSHLAAVQLHLGASAAASELSALWLYGLVDRPPARPHVLLPHARRVSPRQTVIRRSRFVEDDDLTSVDGLSVLRMPFLLLAVAPHAGIDTLQGLALDARQQRLLETDALAARLDRVGRIPGRRRVERVLADLHADGSDSVFESRVRERLRAIGLAPSAAPVPVHMRDGRTVHFDIAFVRERVAIECQGHVAHRSRRQLDRDARRDNAIALSDDWLVLKLTWYRFRNDWEGFVAELRAALASRH